MVHLHNFGSALRIFLKFSTNERGQQVHGNYMNGFSEKILIWGKWTNLGLKMVDPHNSRSTLRIFLKFCTIKGAKSCMEIIVMVFLKNSHLGQMGHFTLKVAPRHKPEFTQRIFFEILHNQRGQDIHKNQFNVPPPKKKKFKYHNSGSTLRIFFL